MDACRRRGKPPAALEWLEGLGVDVAKAVKLVVATHWHDDHVKGLAETLRACEGAAFVCSSALLSDELITLACDAKSACLRSSSGLDEPNGVLEVLRDRRRGTVSRTVGSGYTLVSADKRVFLRTSEPSCEVWSLSPSSAEIELSLRHFATMIESQAHGQARRRITSSTPNNTAVALWVSVGERVMLLGADLEERRENPRGRPACDAGWTAIIGSAARPQGRAEVFKVAHHGSETAHNDEIWTTLVAEEPTAVLTPFEKGRVRLPGKDDCERILDRAALAYSSARHRHQR